MILWSTGLLAVIRHGGKPRILISVAREPQVDATNLVGYSMHSSECLETQILGTILGAPSICLI